MNPCAGLGFARGRGHHGDNLVPILDVAEIERHFRSAEAVKWPWPSMNPGMARRPREVDDFGVRVR